jgi:exosortase B
MLLKRAPVLSLPAPTSWPALVIVGALLALLVPSYFMLAERVWHTDEQGHGPIILAVTLWLAWQRRQELMALPDKPAWAAGLVTLAVGLALYVVGRSQQVDTIEVGSHIPLLASALLLTRGWKGLRWGAFFLFFLLFMVPLPGLIVQAMTTPLKIVVSYAAEWLLHIADYPVARTGVILYVGQYQLLVADACAGLNSMFTLEALGLLYMNLMRYTNPVRNVTLAILIIPIAFAANVIRVIVLVLVTYYFGDAAGQGFVHGFAGMVLFVVALSLMLVTDGLLGRIFKDNRRGPPTGATPEHAKA